jgi:hypothetical protein
VEIKILQSKKFQAAMAALIVAITAEFAFDLDEQTVLTIISPILAYIGGQAIADIGKEKAIADAEATAAAKITALKYGREEVNNTVTTL